MNKISLVKKKKNYCSFKTIGKYPLGVFESGIEHFRAKKLFGKGIKIGVLDTGIVNHVDLQKYNQQRDETVIISYDPNYDDHGTHVAGILCGDGGIIGMCPEADLRSYRVLDGKGFGYVDDVIIGIKSAVDDGCDIINMSLAFLESDLSKLEKTNLHQAVKYAENNDVLIVCSCGNEATVGNPKEYPACFSEVFSVGAIEIDPVKSVVKHSRFSNYNSEVDFCSDGEGIYSLTFKDGYECYDGTSFATAHISGYCALIKGYLLDNKKRAKIFDIKKIMKSQKHVIDLGDKNCYNYYGKMKKGRDNFSGYGFCTLYAQLGLQKLFLDLKMKLKIK